MTVGRQSTRAILLDDQDRLVLIKRTKPGRPTYWTAPGGGVEDTDDGLEAALHRELAEELGARTVTTGRIFLYSTPTDGGVSVQHFFLARLQAFDPSTRSGPELNDPARGGYQIDRIDLTDAALAAIDLKPDELKDFILANREALLAVAPTGVSRTSTTG